MTKEAAPAVESLEELVELASLSELHPFEFSGRATAAPSEEPSDPEVQIQYAERHTLTELVDRFRFQVNTGDAVYVADIEAVFSLEEPREIPQDIRVGFAERIGFMVVFPFLRESLATSASRLGRRAPLVNLMRPGDFRIGVDEDTLEEQPE